MTTKAIDIMSKYLDRYPMASRNAPTEEASVDMNILRIRGPTQKFYPGDSLRKLEPETSQRHSRAHLSCPSD